MNRFANLVATVVVIGALVGNSPGARGDAHHVPLDGSDKTVRAEEFGYRIEVATTDGVTTVRIVLTPAAAKAFSDGRLRLAKGDAEVMSSVVGLKPRTGTEGGVLELKLDTRFFDDGELILWSAPIPRQPLTRNFGGFRLSIKTLLASAAAEKKVEKVTPAPPTGGGLTPEKVKKSNDLWRDAQEEQLRGELARYLRLLEGKVPTGEQYSAFGALALMNLPVAEAIPIYTRLLDHPHDWVKAGAMDELVRFGSRARLAGPKMYALYQNTETVSWLRDKAVVSMARVGHSTPEIIDVLLAVLDGPRMLESTKSNLLDAIGYIGPPAKKILPSLNKCLADRSVPVQFKAYRAQGQVHGEARPTLDELKQLKTFEWKTLPDQGFATLMVFQQAGTRAAFGVPVLLACFEQQPPPYLRIMLLETLQQIGTSDPDAVRTLVNAEALVRVDGDNKACVAMVGAGLLHEKPKVRQQCRLVLARLDRRAEPALPSLIEALKLADGKTTKEEIGGYIQLLGKIGPGAAEHYDLLLRLLAADAPLYKNRKPEEVKLIRAYLLAIMADVGVTKDALPFIREFLGSKDYYLVAAGARAAGALGPQAADTVPLLNAVLKSAAGDNDIRLSFNAPFDTHFATFDVEVPGTSARGQAHAALKRIEEKPGP